MQAQFGYGVKGTYSIPFNTQEEIKYDDSQDFLIYKVLFQEIDVSPSLSLLAYYRNEVIYFQSEIRYKNIRTRFRADNYLDLSNITSLENVKQTHTMEMPLIAGVRIERFKLGVGPIFSYILSDNRIFQDIDYFEERRSKVEFGFGFHAGLVLYRLHLDLSYHYRFNGVADYLYWRKDYRGFSQPIQFIELGLALVLGQSS